MEPSGAQPTKVAGFVRAGGLWIAVAVLGAALLAPAEAGGQQSKSSKGDLTPDQKKLDSEFKQAIEPLVKKYCLDCHNNDLNKGNFSFEKYPGVKDILANQAHFEKVIQYVRSEVMPPPGMDKPSKDERDKLVGFLQRVYSSNCDLIQAGKVTIRRLNRTEYNYTIQDLLGVNLSPADDFPSDNVGYGFDNVGDVLSLSPLQIDKYMEAARQVVDKAIVVPKPMHMQAPLDKWVDGKAAINTNPNLNGGVMMFSNATGNWPVSVDYPGNYTLTIEAGQTPGGPDFAKMAVGLNGKLLQTFDVKAPAASPAEYKIPVRLERGNFNVAVAFTNDFYDPQAPAGKQDRNLAVLKVSLDGPEGGVVPSIPESHRRIIYRTPVGGNDVEVARELLKNFGSRAYRRPIDETELDRLIEIYKKVRSKGDPFERAIQVCVQAILVNPNFLFRVELDEHAKTGSDREINPYELASRLSYFLWSSLPDVELDKLAASGELKDPKVLDAQITRMLADPKADRLGSNFALQWLEVKRISEVLPDPSYGTFNEKTKADLLSEVKLFFMDMVNQNRPIMEFVTSDYTFLNEDLAQHYQIPGVTGDQFQRVNVKKYKRGGILGMGSVLTVTSNPNRTSPVKRGKWVMEAVLGTPPPPPPPNVGVLADDQHEVTAKTIRERMEQHRSNPACATCHKPLDAIGFSMENFDPVGRWRTKDGNFDVDALGEMPDGSKVNGIDGLRKLIVNRKDDFERAMAEKLLTFAIGRGMTAADGCLIDGIVERTRKRGGKMKDLITEIIKSDAFMKRTVTGGQQP